MSGTTVRALPAVRPGWERDADVVVVGSGAAGIATALGAAGHGLRVLVVTKELAGGATPLAQGGLAAAIGPGDSAAAHVRDTLIAGAGLCDPPAVAALAAGAPAAIGWLIAAGARLDQTALRLEGGHSSRRIVHSGDDATGAEVHRALRAALRGALRAGRVEVLDGGVALDLLLRPEGAAAGLLAATAGPDGGLTPGVITAGSVVLAAGGLGQAFATTSNPRGATGDALAIAARAGAELRDPEFVQFHPTVLWLPGATGQCPLITEALRGAGAVLRDLAGRPLMAGHHPRGDLAPRDVVAARMHQTICGGGHLWLDATALGREALETGFPTVTAACRAHGIDPVTSWIPVAPGAHYSCGGILAGLDGRTSIPGLYAVGEAASTGVQGANRLASNSVTEAVIAGQRAGAAIGRELSGNRGPGVRRGDHEGLRMPPAGGGVSPAARGDLAAAMSRDAGVMRDRQGLERLARTLERAAGARRESGGTALGGTALGGTAWGGTATGGTATGGTATGGTATGGTATGGTATGGTAWGGTAWGGTALGGTATGGGRADGQPGDRSADGALDLATVEATNLHTVSALIAAAALRRQESRGCHRRRDAAQTAAAPWHTLVRWDGRRLHVTEEAQ